jgi:hypothetical protein
MMVVGNAGEAMLMPFQQATGPRLFTTREVAQPERERDRSRGGGTQRAKRDFGGERRKEYGMDDVDKHARTEQSRKVWLVSCSSQADHHMRIGWNR